MWAAPSNVPNDVHHHLYFHQHSLQLPIWQPFQNEVNLTSSQRVSSQQGCSTLHHHSFQDSTLQNQTLAWALVKETHHPGNRAVVRSLGLGSSQVAKTK
eukprot:9724382-Prorocentrum_lima.AAC.1